MFKNLPINYSLISSHSNEKINLWNMHEQLFLKLLKNYQIIHGEPRTHEFF